MMTVIVLPASFVMNRFIYHHGSMRTVLGLLTGFGSIFSFVIVVFFRLFSGKKAHYFGLLPIIQSGGTLGLTSSGSYLEGIIVRIFEYVFHPFIMFYENDQDTNGYELSIEPLIAKEGKKVDEGLFLASRKAGEISDPIAWAKAVDKLVEPTKKLFADEHYMPV